MRSLVIGGDSFIGSRLCGELAGDLLWTSRRHGRGHSIHLDLLNVHDSLPDADAVFICAAMTRFIDCEANPDAYRINVDAPMKIAAMRAWKVIFLSSESVEKALHTNYGMQKALAEMGLWQVCQPRIARLSKVTPETVGSACKFIASLVHMPAGVYRWPQQQEMRIAA